MKIHYHNPLLHKLADKYEVKKYVASIIGEEYVVDSLGVWNNPREIDFDSLPNSFVLKCTHDSGSTLVCRDKAVFDKEAAVLKLEDKIRHDYSLRLREWAYRGIEPRVIADRYLSDYSGRVLLDYKFWCFNGVPRYMYITVKDSEIFENFFDMDFVPVDVNHGFKRKTPEFVMPTSFELMKHLAAKLSKGLPFARIDFFEVDGHPYFGEYTFYDWAGLQPFASYEQDLELGALITLPSAIQ